MDGSASDTSGAENAEHEDSSPRDPERSPLHQILRDHLATYVEERENAGAPLPKFVVKGIRCTRTVVAA